MKWLNNDMQESVHLNYDWGRVEEDLGAPTVIGVPVLSARPLPGAIHEISASFLFMADLLVSASMYA